MQFIAQARGVKISSRKIRIVAETVRRQPVEKALTILSIMDKRGATALERAVRSAAANALHTKQVPAEQLLVKTIDVLEGQAMKRFHPSTRGRVHPYKKRTSHVKVILEKREKREENSVSV